MHAFLNPYIAGDPVGKTPAFVGRADVLREVLRVLRHPHQNAIVLYGQRRIGKTSILQWLEAHLPEEGPYRPVYLDLMTYSGQPLDILLRDLARGIARALGQPKPVLEGDVQDAFREQFIPQMLAALPEETALVLLMDEFDVQADLSADREIKRAFFSYMRSLRQVVPQQLKFVFVLGRTIDELDIVARGLFKDLPSKRVSLLSREDTEALVRSAERQGSLRWTQPAVEAVWELTHGHPYLVQALCAEVWETLHEDWEGESIPKARRADVEAAVEPVLERSAHMFAWIWEGLGPAEKVAAAALAEAGPEPVSEDRLEAILTESGVRIVIRELRDAPRQLQAWDILEKVEAGYRFRVELLRRWIAEHHPLDRTQDELDRIHPVADNLYQAARGLYERGDLEVARDTLERALGLNPSHQGALELLGEITLAQGDLDAAQEALERLRNLSPSRARERLVQVYLRRAEVATDDEEQEQWYRRVLEVWPDNRQARKALEALEAARRVAALQAEHEAILQLERAGQYHTALERAKALHERYPDADFLPALLERLQRKARLAGLFREAQTALEKDDPDAAIPALQEIIALEPAYRDGEAAALLCQAVCGENPVALEQDLKAAQERLRSLRQAKKDLQKKAKTLADENIALKADKERLQTALADCEKRVSRAEQRAKASKNKAQGTEARLPAPPSAEHVPARLSPWNPLDYLRLLFWIFFSRARLEAHRKAYGKGAEEPVGNRLVLTLAFWPLLGPALGLGLGLLPRTELAWKPTTYLWVAVGTAGLWLFFSLFADVLGEEEGFVVAGVWAVGVAFGVAVGVAFGVAVGVAVGVAFGVAVGVAFGVAVDVAFDVAVDVAVGVAVGVAFGVAVDVAFDVAFDVAVGVAVGVAFGVAGVGAGIVVGVVAFVVALVVAFVVAVGVDEGPPILRALLGLLGLAALLALTFFSLGGWLWLQTGHWPAPVWPF